MQKKTFHISRKLNYDIETPEKKARVDQISDFIRNTLLNVGYIEVSNYEDTIDYIFSIGGDGTMLHSMHYNIWKHSLIVGINAGNVGFLTPFSIEDILHSDLVSLIEDNPRIENRSILEHWIYDKRGVAVNEYAITSDQPNGMINFSVEVEHRGKIHRAGDYRANALLVSGPCGSTAYNMNAGGAIVDPSVKCMQMIMVAPTTLGSRPLIFGLNTTLHITVKNLAKIFSDGIEYHSMNPGDKMSIALMQQESKIIVPKNWNFYSALAKKLHWNNGKDV